MVKIIDNEVSGLPVIDWAHGKPTMIVMHETGNDSSTVSGEIDYMANHYENAFYHGIAAKDGLHMVHDPDKGGAWGAGPETHAYAIHIEMVRYQNEDDFKAAYDNWVGGAKHFADKYEIPVKLNHYSSKKGIVTHSYVTRTWGGTTHTDPDGYLKQHGVSISQLAKNLGDSNAKKVESAPKRKEKADAVSSSGGETVLLPASSNSWRIYPVNAAPTKGNEKGFLNPAKFGGLEYDVLGHPQKDVVTIKSGDFGKGNIYVGSGTGAKVSGDSSGGHSNSSGGSGKKGKLKIAGVGNAAYVMDKPNRNNSNNLGTVPLGDTLPLNGSVKGKGSDTGYWEVEFEGHLGYITGKYGKQV